MVAAATSVSALPASSAQLDHQVAHQPLPSVLLATTAQLALQASVVMAPAAAGTFAPRVLALCSSNHVHAAFIVLLAAELSLHVHWAFFAT
jgi:hypothetical protein